MICNPCRENEHEKCPSKLAVDPKKKPTGLGPENEAIQRSGLCPCRHRAPRVLETGEFHEAIRRANAKMVSVSLTPSPSFGVA